MSKRPAPRNRPEITLEQHASVPLYRQLYERLRTQILAGQLEPGTRLPSTRVLASEMGVSRTTTALAYEQLLLEGYIESRVGDGTRVACLYPKQVSRGCKNLEEQASRDPEGAQSAELAQRGSLLVNTPYPGAFLDTQASTGMSLFPAGRPDVASFPYEIWARLVVKRARHSLQATSLYQHPQGYFPLREAIAAHIGITRGVHCSGEQIILTAGSQGALDLVARVVIDPGDPAWIEDPGYFGARGALLAAGARLIPVPVDQEGMDVEVGRQLFREARLAVVTPSHQFPTGVTMSLSRRLALLEWAREVHAWIIEDDYDSEYRFGGRPLEALQGLDSAERVIYMGTFSKVLFPSLRLGYVVAPPGLLKGLIAARRFIDVHLPLLEQMALADFMREGHFARHLRHMCLLYGERRNALIEALNQELGDLLEVARPEAGMHLAAWLPLGMSDQMASRIAATQGLNILPLSSFSLRPFQRGGLLLGFASTPPEALRSGVKMLADVLRAL